MAVADARVTTRSRLSSGGGQHLDPCASGGRGRRRGRQGARPAGDHGLAARRRGREGRGGSHLARIKELELTIDGEPAMKGSTSPQPACSGSTRPDAVLQGGDLPICTRGQPTRLLQRPMVDDRGKVNPSSIPGPLLAGPKVLNLWPADKPSCGLEPETPSLPWRSWCGRRGFEPGPPRREVC